MWQQRSRALWLQSGDWNTKFFHCQATHRRRRNHIKGLRDNMGLWQSWDANVEKIIVSYYKDLFDSSTPGEFLEVLEGVEQVVTDDMNATLIPNFSEGEIKYALK